MSKRTIRKRRGGFIFTGITVLASSIGAYKIKTMQTRLKKELNKLDSKQLRQLLKKISPKKKLKSDKSIIKFILSKINPRNKRTKGIIERTKHKIKRGLKQYKLYNLYLKYIKEIKK